MKTKHSKHRLPIHQPVSNHQAQPGSLPVHQSVSDLVEHNPAHGSAKTVTAKHRAKLELVRVEYIRAGRRYVHDFTGLKPFILTMHDTNGKQLANYALLDLHSGRFDGYEFDDQ
jgi:hypothetical protein